jgi:hypothetical protein
VSKYNLGPKTGFASAVRIAIYVWVSTLLAFILLEPTVLINLGRYYGAMVPSLLTVISGVGFAILNSIVGGQALSSIASFSWT